MARSAFHKLPIAAIPQYRTAALSHVEIAEPPKHGNTATGHDRNPAEHEPINTVTTASDIATMTHHRICEMPDWTISALRQGGNRDLPKRDNA